MEVSFQSRHHQQLFSALLADFLEPVSLLGDNRADSLAILESICRSPQFDEGGLVEFLEEPTAALNDWLEKEVTIPTWLPSIDRQVELRMARREFVYQCGAISKHSLGRLTRTAARFVKVLNLHGVDVSELDALLALDDFYDRFHDDVLNYHASVIAESLNNIRWGMWEYLRPTFMKSFQQLGELEYTYRMPQGLDHDFARGCFWDAMNDVRRKPFVERFHANDILRLRY
ncbi:MAG: hypothetical protein AB7F94_18070 [Nitrospira sp.]